MGKHRRARARELSELSELESVWNDLWSQLAKQLSEAGDPALSRLRPPGRSVFAGSARQDSCASTCFATTMSWTATPVMSQTVI
jgi:hypothetical protein